MLVRHLKAIFSEMRKGPSGTAVVDIAEPPAAPEPKPPTAWQAVRKQVPGGTLVYIPHRAADPSRLRDELRRRNYDLVVLDHGLGKVSERRHQTNLKFCDGLVWSMATAASSGRRKSHRRRGWPLESRAVRPESASCGDQGVRVRAGQRSRRPARAVRSGRHRAARRLPRHAVAAGHAMTSVPPGGTAAAPAASNPFVGLRRFDLTDSHLFFGRDETDLPPAATASSHALSRGHRTFRLRQVVADPGGRDGGAPRRLSCRRWRLAAGDAAAGKWTARGVGRRAPPYVRPGTPDEAIVADPAAVLDTRTGPIAILVDQFEELFQFAARTGKTNDARAFVESIIRTGAPDARVYTILTMRSEYLAQCAEYPLLADAINSGLHLVSRMTPAQVRDAIVMPVHNAGAAITVALTNRLADEAAREADGLPVLQHALMRMWASRAPFEPLGESPLGTEAASASSSTITPSRSMESLSPEQKAAAEKLFRCITEMTDEGNLGATGERARSGFRPRRVYRSARCAKSSPHSNGKAFSS